VGIIKPSSGTARRATIAIASNNVGAAVRVATTTTSGITVDGGGPTNAFVASSFGGGGAVFDLSWGVMPNIVSHCSVVKAWPPNTPKVNG
jgi:hypothetical protein